MYCLVKTTRRRSLPVTEISKTISNVIVRRLKSAVAQENSLTDENIAKSSPPPLDHYPVMVRRTMMAIGLEGHPLPDRPQIFVDATFGAGGHTIAMLSM